MSYNALSRLPVSPPGLPGATEVKENSPAVYYFTVYPLLVVVSIVSILFVIIL